MASLATLKQVMAVAMCEGLVEMMWAQRYRDQYNNKTFAGMRERMRRDTQAAYKAIYASGQKLSFDEWEQLKDKAGRFKNSAFPNGFMPMDAVGMMVDLITEQLSFCRPGTLKNAAFDRLLNRVREFERYFDRKKAYDDPAGMAAGDALRRTITAW